MIVFDDLKADIITGSYNRAHLLSNYGIDHQTPLQYAAFLGRIEMMELLLSCGAPFDSNLFSYACKGGHTPFLIHLLKLKKFKASGVDKNGLPPLFHLCSSFYNGQSRINSLDLLLKNGAKINIGREEDGCTPLMRACQFGSYELIKALLSRKANIKLKSKDGKEAFHYLAVRQNGIKMPEMVELLMKYGGDINEKDKEGNTPLTLAWRDRAPFGTYAMSLKCISSISPSVLRSALFLFSKGVNKQLLENFPQNTNNILAAACSAGNWDAMELALKHGADVCFILFFVFLIIISYLLILVPK